MSHHINRNAFFLAFLVVPHQTYNKNNSNNSNVMITTMMRSTSSNKAIRQTWQVFPRAVVASRKQQQQRCFHSPREFAQWRQDVQDARLHIAPPLSLQSLKFATHAPFLYSVSPMADHLELAGFGNNNSDNKPKSGGASPYDSFLQCTFPIASDALLRNSVADFSNWSSFRLGKFYESVDALTADVAYRHVQLASSSDSNHDNDGVAFVTAGHYHSRKFHRTDIHRDVTLRSYITQVGRSSMEVRTDAVQRSTTTTTTANNSHKGQGKGEETLVNVCHTVMVALDAKTMKPLSKVGRSIPPLLTRDDDTAAQRRLALAKQHAQIRQDRQAHAMQLRAPVSAPPTATEMQRIHAYHQTQVLLAEQPQQSQSTTATTNTAVTASPTVADYTFRSSTVIFPEQRNVHGKLFGGYVMEEAQKLAQYAATFLARGQPLVSFGIDEAIFLQPIGIGDLVTFTARVVHTTGFSCRVLVLVEVRNAQDRNRVPRRSNRLMFVFGASPHHNAASGNDTCDTPSLPPSIIPERYGEILMHIDAHRRHEVEGPFADEVQAICQESAKIATS